MEIICTDPAILYCAEISKKWWHRSHEAFLIFEGIATGYGLDDSGVAV
jgi:hypothetical protein